MTEEIKKPEEPTQSTHGVKLPPLPTTEMPFFQWNPETKMFWIGIPVMKMGPIELMLILDSVKADVVMSHKEAVMSQARANKLIVPKNGIFSSAKQAMKNFVAGK